MQILTISVDIDFIQLKHHKSLILGLFAKMFSYLFIQIW